MLLSSVCFEDGLNSDFAPCPKSASSGHCCSVCRRSRPNPSWPLLALRDMDQERTSHPRRRALCGDEWPEGTTPTEASTLTDTSLSTIYREYIDCLNRQDWARRGDTLQLPFNDPNLDKEATTNGPEAQNEGQDIRKER